MGGPLLGEAYTGEALVGRPLLREALLWRLY